jgi:hypothetical protein
MLSTQAWDMQHTATVSCNFRRHVDTVMSRAKGLMSRAKERDLQIVAMTARSKGKKWNSLPTDCPSVHQCMTLHRHAVTKKWVTVFLFMSSTSATTTSSATSHNHHDDQGITNKPVTDLMSSLLSLTAVSSSLNHGQGAESCGQR